MNPSTVTLETSGEVARLTLNRPERLNCFNLGMLAEARDAIARVERERARVLVITGAGRAFCSGQDLTERADAAAGEPADLGALLGQRYKPLILALRRLPIPVIAAINGAAAGAGMNLALVCDIVIAKRSAIFIQPFCNLGLVPDCGGTWTLPRLVGTGRALGLVMFGNRLTAEEAERWGLIWQCVDDDAFEARVDALARQLASAPRLALARTKEAIYSSWERSFEEQIDVECAMQRELGYSADFAEGISAFLGKRRPTFGGE